MAGPTYKPLRPIGRLQGERFWPSGGMEPTGRAGHVPSAVHQPAEDLYDGRGSFRSAAALRSLFSSVNLDGDEELITYCTIGDAPARPGSSSPTCLGVITSASTTGRGLSGAAWPALPSSGHKLSHSRITMAPIPGPAEAKLTQGIHAETFRVTCPRFHGFRLTDGEARLGFRRRASRPRAAGLAWRAWTGRRGGGGPRPPSPAGAKTPRGTPAPPAPAPAPFPGGSGPAPPP